MLASKGVVLVLIFTFGLCLSIKIGGGDSVFAGEKGAGGKLKIDAVFRHYRKGPKRLAVIAPGETLYVEASLSGYSIGPDGNPKFSFSAEAVASNGKKIFAEEPVHLNVPTSSFDKFKSIFSYSLVFNENTLPGKYTLQIKVTDDLNQRHTSISLPFTILPDSAFTVYDIQLASDQDFRNLDSNFTVVNYIFARFRVAGGSVRKDQIKTKGTVTFYNQNSPSKSLGSSVKHHEINNPRYGKLVLTYDFSVSVGSPGNYLVKMEIEDLNNGRKSVHFIPFAVHDPAEFDISVVESKLIPVEAVKRKPAKRVR